MVWFFALVQFIHLWLGGKRLSISACISSFAFDLVAIPMCSHRPISGYRHSVGSSLALVLWKSYPLRPNLAQPHCWQGGRWMGDQKRLFWPTFFTLSDYIYSRSLWLSTMPHVVITHGRLFHLCNPGWCSRASIETKLLWHFQEKM